MLEIESPRSESVILLFTGSSITIRPIPDQQYESDAELSVLPVRYGEGLYSHRDAINEAGAQGSALRHTVRT